MDCIGEKGKGSILSHFLTLLSRQIGVLKHEELDKSRMYIIPPKRKTEEIASNTALYREVHKMLLK